MATAQYQLNTNMKEREKTIEVKVRLTQKELKQLKRIAEIQTENNEAVVRASLKVLINNNL